MNDVNNLKSVTPYLFEGRFCAFCKRLYQIFHVVDLKIMA